MKRIFSGAFPPHNYEINGCRQSLLYYLADGIYPNWALFVKTISENLSEKDKHFATAQEAIIKDAERDFGVLLMR